MPTYGWGASPWGSGMGGGGGSPMSIVDAYAVSERQVQVVLSSAPRAVSTIGVGDALNPLTWSVKRIDTGEELVVLAVRMLDTMTAELYTLHKFYPALVEHRVSAPTLLNAGGGPIIPPTQDDFPGCFAEPHADVKQGISDFVNMPVSDQDFGGVLVVDSSGDYAHQSGVPLLMKLVIRRLVTAQTEFFYLDDYGLGLRVKETLRYSDIPKVQAAAQLQLLQEPEFATVAVALVLKNSGVLYIGVHAVLRKDNSQVSVNIPVPTNLVAL